MKVKLMVFTPMPEYWCYIASKVCRSPVGPIEMLNHVQIPEDIYAHIKARLKDGHHSIFEHVSFTFGVEGISRTCSHQLVRHRIASYSQQSQRHVIGDYKTELKDFNEIFVIPKGVLSKFNGDARKIYLMSLLKDSKNLYDYMVKIGVPKEDARFFLPQAIKTNIVITMNARELLHFFNLRLHPSAQWEIRKLAKLMLQEVKKVAPIIFEGYE